MSSPVLRSIIEPLWFGTGHAGIGRHVKLGTNSSPDLKSISDPAPNADGQTGRSRQLTPEINKWWFEINGNIDFSFFWWFLLYLTVVYVVSKKEFASQGTLFIVDENSTQCNLHKYTTPNKG